MKHRITIVLFLLALSALLYFGWKEWFLIPGIVLLVLALSFIIFLGVVDMRLGYFMPVIHRFPNGKVLLTFDDGPDALTPEIVAILNRENVAALFFVIGEKAVKQPELLRQMLQDGHGIGNHSWSHPNFFATAGPKVVEAEMLKNYEVLKELTGQERIPFRPPIGFLNPIIVKAIKKYRFPVIGWSRRTRDTVRKNAGELKQLLLKSSTPGSIILLHDTQQITLDVLSEYIQEAKKNGTIFANRDDLSEFLKTIYR